MDAVQKVKAALAKGGFKDDELQFLSVTDAGKVFGTVVSNRFKDIDSPHRFDMVWKTLEDNLPDANELVVTLFTLTWDEHNDYATEA